MPTPPATSRTQRTVYLVPTMALALTGAAAKTASAAAARQAALSSKRGGECMWCHRAWYAPLPTTWRGPSDWHDGRLPRPCPFPQPTLFTPPEHSMGMVMRGKSH